MSTISTPQLGGTASSASFASPSGGAGLSSSPRPSFPAASISLPISSQLHNTPLQPNTTFRRLVWGGTIPIAVSLDPSELPPGSDQTLATAYLVVPRVSYLPLIIEDVRKSLVELALEDSALASLDDKEWWFEYDGQPLRWHWPIGLLYDYHTANPAPSTIPTSAAGTATTATSASRYDGLLASAGPALPHAESSTAAARQVEMSALGRLPWRIQLRLSKPPLERLHSKAGVDICRTSFMSMIKEADFVRYGSTKKVVNLRRQEQDALWEGVVQHDFDAYWTVAHKLVPSTQPLATSSSVDADRDLLNRTTSTLRPGPSGAASDDRTLSAMPRPASFMSQSNESQASLAPSMVSTMTATTTSDAHGSGGSATPSGASSGAAAAAAAAGGIRSVPIRILLPDGAPTVQEPVSPLLDDGRPATLATLLSGLFPLLFPPPPSFSSFQQPSPPLAYAVIQGVRMPLDAEVGWLGSTLLSPDGWLTIVVGLLPA